MVNDYLWSDALETVPAMSKLLKGNISMHVKQLGTNERSKQSKYTLGGNGKGNMYQCELYSGQPTNWTNFV